MGIRGPKTNRLKPVKPANPRRPNPKPGMSPRARTVWLRIVKAYPVDHFKPQHHDLLKAYCEAAAIRDECVAELKNEGLRITQPNGVKKENPLIGTIDKMAGRMTALSVKLGISVNNTTVNRGIKGSIPKPKSKRKGLIYAERE